MGLEAMQAVEVVVGGGGGGRQRRLRRSPPVLRLAVCQRRLESVRPGVAVAQAQHAWLHLARVRQLLGQVFRETFGAWADDNIARLDAMQPAIVSALTLYEVPSAPVATGAITGTTPLSRRSCSSGARTACGQRARLSSGKGGPPASHPAAHLPSPFHR